eukprot:CAMPEP_0175039910 /NCGR_PEP_ID=MMETSP0052_2-20121109/911_1 /TAXON_ID=51329 ORGANISM="Polytomella parva, Strain SAG 63-3" /NCGR_SAMPLE_ID=MMETSP0052_2 /ASSEMBLY_ACC=CAM_ASM_000194 /LENGTH=46 /DNA_ID= /DNA_START= /DNA_END= /DNA_ORIENTATION=
MNEASFWEPWAVDMGAGVGVEEEGMEEEEEEEEERSKRRGGGLGEK